MMVSIWLHTAARQGVSAFFLVVLLMGQSPIVWAESLAQRYELAGALRHLGALEHTIVGSAAHASVVPGERYHFDYPRLLADLARVRAGIQDYLAPSRAQPRDPAELAGDYRAERGLEPQAPLPPTTAVESRP
ncbi:MULTISPECIES: integrative conjugative element protein, RAQPRD family [Alcaligenaceae]|jgi:RAQPRD family integrative conjugative element protein|uniref:RAQPRD family integrative conjugative element protein n=1 Tax=Eoetvoesiella caeni TaxID=645616 RepID=A0A366H533_9BURK|nr:RAQPRD family integrative conjugative element protein [Eoetvoesiella caeni]MCI2810316.1 RAQPRD family integrative conjugative element protein [Eoetvoesiella caeni]NYT54685.1 RAQPRD family integrative conjugative element protein [Eoetvoesiella caeni]RBP37146.1 RAQPRD family integrative conjugative element protein [Eoetvoesiella caeni]